MTAPATADKVDERLRDLEQRMHHQETRISERGVATELLDQDWDEMLRRHQELRSRLEKDENISAEVIGELQADADALSHSFERWLARVDRRFDRGST